MWPLLEWTWTMPTGLRTPSCRCAALLPVPLLLVGCAEGVGARCRRANNLLASVWIIQISGGLSQDKCHMLYPRHGMLLFPGPCPLPLLQRLLPEGLEVPSSFETVGHIAHLNLREELLPYKHIVGQVGRPAPRCLVSPCPPPVLPCLPACSLAACARPALPLGKPWASHGSQALALLPPCL